MPEPDVLPVVEEALSVETRAVQTGRVTIETVTEAFDDIARAELGASDVEVTRVAVDREIDSMPEVRVEGDVTVVPVVEEVLVVTKRLVLREELHITRRRSSTTVEVPVTLRRQRAIVTREGREDQYHGESKMADSLADRKLTAFFEDRTAADDAVDRLRALGITDASIRLTGGEEYTSRRDYESDRGFWDSISDFFFPSEERGAYAEGLRRGGYLLTVSSVPEGYEESVIDILDDEGSIDLDERSSAWRSEGWSGGAKGAGVSSGSTSGREARLGYEAEATALGQGIAGERSDEAIPVIEERLRVGKRDVNLGRVRVRAYTVEEPVSEDITLREERAEIERRPVDRPLEPGEASFTDRTIEAEEHAEEAVVSKEARVVEEIGIVRRSDERTETVSDTVRHTEVEVEDDRSDARASRSTTRTGV